MSFEPKEIAQRVLKWAYVHEPGAAIRYQHADSAGRREILKRVLALYLKVKPLEIGTLPESLWIKLGWRKVQESDSKINALASLLPGSKVTTYRATEELRTNYPWLVDPEEPAEMIEAEAQGVSDQKGVAYEI